MGRTLTLILLICCIILVSVIRLSTKASSTKSIPVHQPIQAQVLQYRLSERTTQMEVPPGPEIWLKASDSPVKEMPHAPEQTEAHEKEEDPKQPHIIEY